MAVARVAAQRVKNARGHAQPAALLKMQAGGHRVRLGKGQVQRFAAEQIGIAGQFLHRVGAKGFESRHRLLGVEAVLGKPGHHLPHTVHPAEFPGNDRGFLRCDAAQLSQPLGGLCNDGEGLLAEFFNNFAGGAGADIGQHAAG